MSNKKKFEKNITKKLKKMYAAAKMNPNTESRLLFVSGKYGFSVIRMEEVPGSGLSFVDSAELIMNKTLGRALSSSNMDDRSNINSIKARMYDGHSLEKSLGVKRDVIGTSVDYAKMQGIDLDEAVERQRDNYDGSPYGSHGVIMSADGTHIRLKDLKMTYEKTVADTKKLEQKLNEAHDKEAEDYKKIEELEKKVAEMTKTISDQYAKNVALQKDMDGTMAKLNSITEERDRLQKFYDDAKSKDTDADASANDDAEELETVSNVLRDEAAVDKLPKVLSPSEEELIMMDLPTNSKTTVRETTVSAPFRLPIHKDELPDDYMLTLLQNTKKPYSLRTIFKLQSNIYDEIVPDVYDAIIGIRDPRITNVRNFSRDAYATAIALSIPEGYVESFIKRFIEDYNCGNFKPTDPKYVPEDFPKFLNSLYPDIARIHRLLHTETRNLPWVYTVKNGNLTEYFLIGPRSYDNPSDIKSRDNYVAIPRSENPYDFLEFGKTKELVMVFEHANKKMFRHKPIQSALKDTEVLHTSDHVLTLTDQIDRYIAANKAGLIDLEYTNPDEILENGLWFYPVVKTWSVRRFPVRNYPTNTHSEISSEPKQDSNEK